ncbi:TPA: trigger factor [Candidatus Gastranaerophilales bacterium HUM_9]|mgnify:CR=1 FL=1|nr:MAG TPA: trigger factor [Candidatus Gastranaerophilales bacterium HUM_9]HBX35165.1 trigger factor [Cyanobacteria bacterium UBA11440]
MKIDLEKKEQNIAKVDIEIPAKEGLEAYNRAVKTYAQHVNIPGFRRGKAPRNIVERQVGKERIITEALETLLPSAFSKVITENNLDILTQPKVENYDFEVGKDVKVTATIELKPEVKIKEYKNMTVEVEEYETPKDAFDKSLENILSQSATLELVVDRKTQKDDVIVFDFDGYVNGEKIEHGDAKNYTMDLANSNFIPGFAEQLVDREIDKEFDVNVTFPETYHEQKLAGQPAVFKCVIHEIKTKVMPELTDEFAQKVGPFKTVDELKADIQDYLDKQKEVADKKASEKAILDKIHENTEIDIHDSMIKREADSLLEDYKQKLKTQGFTWEQAVETQGLDKIMETINSDAVFRIKNSLIIDKIAKEEDLKVDQESMNEKFESLSAMYQMDKETFGKYLLQSPGMINNISQQILNEKVINFLVENNKVKFVKAK